MNHKLSLLIRSCRTFLLALSTLVMSGCKGHPPTEQDLLNVRAQLPEGLPYPVLQWTALFDGEWIAKHGTTYTIFANEMALRAARTGAGVPLILRARS